MSRSTSNASRLLALPAEVRNRIWEFAVTANSPFEITSKFPNKSSKAHAYGGRQSPLTMVCRQIRQESLQMFYDLNCFRFITGKVMSTLAQDNGFFKPLHIIISRLHEIMDIEIQAGPILASLRNTGSKCDFQLHDPRANKMMERGDVMEKILEMLELRHKLFQDAESQATEKAEFERLRAEQGLVWWIRRGDSGDILRILDTPNVGYWSFYVRDGWTIEEE